MAGGESRGFGEVGREESNYIISRENKKEQLYFWVEGGLVDLEAGEKELHTKSK